MKIRSVKEKAILYFYLFLFSLPLVFFLSKISNIFYVTFLISFGVCLLLWARLECPKCKKRIMRYRAQIDLIGFMRDIDQGECPYCHYPLENIVKPRSKSKKLKINKDKTNRDTSRKLTKWTSSRLSVK